VQFSVSVARATERGSRNENIPLFQLDLGRERGDARSQFCATMASDPTTAIFSVFIV
jgi:hypothetical protein